MTTQDIVAKLWNLCHVLRDDGITYHEYVTELTFLLFLKMAKETGTEDQLPAGYRWDDLQSREGVEQLAFYRSLLVHLGNEGSGRVQAIFHDANTALSQPRNLTRLVRALTNSIGIQRARKGWVICTKACWRRTPARRSREPGSISRHGR